MKGRDPSINSKSAVVDWFKSNPEAKEHFLPVKLFFESNYAGDNYGFINMKSRPEYRINSAATERFVKIIISKGHTRVRFYLDFEDVQSYFEDYCATISNKNGGIHEVVDFVVSSPLDIKPIAEFLKYHNVDNF